MLYVLAIILFFIGIYYTVAGIVDWRWYLVPGLACFVGAVIVLWRM